MSESNERYFYISSAKQISLRSHIRGLSEEIRSRKSLRKSQKIKELICDQLLELKRDFRYINLVRSYFARKTYSKMESKTGSGNRVSLADMLYLIKHYASPWTKNYHTEETVKEWLSK